jgi:hypothetical protein
MQLPDPAPDIHVSEDTGQEEIVKNHNPGRRLKQIEHVFVEGRITELINYPVVRAAGLLKLARGFYAVAGV